MKLKKEEKRESITLNIEKVATIISAVGTIIGAVGAIFAIWLGLNQINLSIREQRFSNRLELADDLISEYIVLSSYASKAVFYLAVDANGASDLLIDTDANYPNYVQMHSEKLETVKGKIMAYGSSELVYLFCDSYNDIQLKIENGQVDFESIKTYFYSMPLIASYIKYDMTGEIINPSIFYNSLMRELKSLEEAKGMDTFHEEMVFKNNELVKKYDLSEEFIWEEIE